MSKLKVLREVHNYTQEFIAEALGVDQSTYSKLEKSPKNLRVEQAEKLAKIYDVDVADIMSQELTISFSNNTIDKAYVHNLFEQRDMMDKVIASKDSEITQLKEQVEHLKKQLENLNKQNDQLLRLMDKGH